MSSDEPTAPLLAPSAIRLEAMSACQLRCPSCPTTTGATKAVIGRGYLRFERFKELIDGNPQVRDVELSNYGEIFLNPELLDIMRYAHERGVALAAETGVNLNTVRPEVLEGLVRYEVRALNCSIDGASEETYRRYRVRGSFEAVIANLRALVEHKRRYDSPYPELTWQFVVFGHNEHEIPLARRMAEELGCSFVPKISWDDEFSPVRDREFVMREAGIQATRDEFKEQTGAAYLQSICHQLWERPQINWDGKNLGCCRNFWGDFGANAFEDGLLEAINSPRMRYARGMLTGDLPPRDDIPCTTCDLYLGMQADGAFVVAPDVN